MAYRSITNEDHAQVNDACSEIPGNRTLLIERFTEEIPLKPEIVRNIKNMEGLFDHYRPEASVTFEDVEGKICRERFTFRNASDFLPANIALKSRLIRQTEMKKAFYRKLIKRLKSDPSFIEAVQQPEARQDLSVMIHNLMEELKNNK